MAPQLNPYTIGSEMSHSKTVQTRRKKEKVKKTNARIAKAANKVKKETAKK